MIFLYFAFYKGLIVLGTDYSECVVGICLCKSVSQPGMFAFVPFKLVGVQHPVNVFNIVYFLLLLCTPEVAFAIKRVVCVMFQSLGDDVIFPQGTSIISLSKRMEIPDNRIAHTIVDKVPFAGF